MSLWTRIADAIIARAKRTPYIHLDGYMNRWWLLPYNRFGIAARVHQILRSDEDRHLHDHPWWYVTIILRGGYLEHTDRGGDMDLKWYGPGSVLFRRASHYHRLVLRRGVGESLYNYPCWTLFITGPKRKDHDPEHSCWGFFVDGKKVPADVYLGDKYIATDYTKGGAR
jgi:hypothetical protein